MPVGKDVPVTVPVAILISCRGDLMVLMVGGKRALQGGFNYLLLGCIDESPCSNKALEGFCDCVGFVVAHFAEKSCRGSTDCVFRCRLIGFAVIN